MNPVAWAKYSVEEYLLAVTTSLKLATLWRENPAHIVRPLYTHPAIALSEQEALHDR